MGWRRFSPLYGKSLKDIAPIPFLKRKDIIKARGGIDYSLEQIDNGVNIALKIGFGDNGKLTKTIEKIPQNNEQKAETYFKSIKNTLLNIWKLETEKNQKANDAEIKALSKKIIGEKNFLTIKNLEKIYKKARLAKNISKEEISNSQKKSKEILLLFKEYLNKK